MLRARSFAANPAVPNTVVVFPTGMIPLFLGQVASAPASATTTRLANHLTARAHLNVLSGQRNAGAHKGTGEDARDAEKDYGSFASEADLFRRIALDERQHKEESLARIEQPRFN